jgi:hypothetical protein
LIGLIKTIIPLNFPATMPTSFADNRYLIKTHHILSKFIILFTDQLAGTVRRSPNTPCPSIYSSFLINFMPRKTKLLDDVIPKLDNSWPAFYFSSARSRRLLTPTSHLTIPNVIQSVSVRIQKGMTRLLLSRR